MKLMQMYQWIQYEKQLFHLKKYPGGVLAEHEGAATL